MGFSRKHKVSLAIAAIGAVGAIGAAATAHALGGSGNNSTITQTGIYNNACLNNSQCAQGK